MAQVVEVARISQALIHFDVVYIAEEVVELRAAEVLDN